MPLERNRPPKGGLVIHRLDVYPNLPVEVAAMAAPIGPRNDTPPPLGKRGLCADKKKGCKQNKCSKWKGGKCRCGRD